MRSSRLRSMVELAVSISLAACGGRVEPSKEDSETSSSESPQAERSSEGDPDDEQGDDAAVTDADHLEVALDCSCGDDPFEVIIVDHAAGTEFRYQRGPRNLPPPADGCKEVLVPSALNPNCRATTLSACNADRQCMQIRFLDGIAQMNLWDFEKDTVRVVTQGNVPFTWTTRGRISSGSLHFVDADQGPLYDVSFSACALLDVDVGPCGP